MCSGGKQSPIDIDPTGATPQNFAPLYAANYDTRDKTMTAINNGHTGNIRCVTRACIYSALFVRLNTDAWLDY